jgi:hypothetical protein
MCATQINECMRAFITELPHCLGLTSQVRTLAQFTLPAPDTTLTHHRTDITLGTHCGTCRWLQFTVTEWHSVILIIVKTIHCALTTDITADIFKQYATPCPPVLTVTCFSHTFPHVPAPRMKPIVFQEYALYALWVSPWCMYLDEDLRE